MIIRIIRVALQGVATHAGRSVLTGLSLFVGILAVVTISAGGKAAEQAILAGSLLTAGGPVTVKAMVDPGPGSYERAKHLSEIMDATLKPVGGAGTVKAEGSILIDGRMVEAVFSAGNLRGVLPFPLRAGRWFSADPVAPAEIVLNEAAARSFDLQPGSVFLAKMGEYSRSMRVVGVVFDGFPEPRGFATLEPGSDWGAWLARAGPATVFAYAPEGDPAALGRLLEVEHNRVIDSIASARVERSDPANPEVHALRTVTLVITVIGGLSLLVGALGILNIGLATLKERSDELSLRRSFGATRTEVVLTMIMEGQVVALSSAATAIAVSWAIFPQVVAQLAGGILLTEVSFASAAALQGAAVGCLAAIAGSLAPAFRAGRVPISSIMRL